ncbi:unnamed protein product [Trifolium pratense]|uniref:Uncharacterized protein n=1 Tax=Trifolium pratense TaxID=57577 RepID=A0ACB0KQT8_TRIPR|nr:unnamed protein product [Trifolium pratense]
MGAGVDVTFDCAGFNKTMTTALNATQPGGKVYLVGMGRSEMTVPVTPQLLQGPHDVRIRMKAVGICGSDVHYLKTMRCADFIVKEPMVIGMSVLGS